MLFDDPEVLEPVVRWFVLCSAALDHEESEVHQMSAQDLEIPPVLSDSLGRGASREDMVEYFGACRRELELAAIFLLAASAEARIRIDASLRMAAKEGDLGRRLHLLESGSRLVWSIPLYEGGILDEWKMYIGSLTDLVGNERARLLTSIGRFKNLLDIRHWVAHGRYWEPRWSVQRFSADDAAGIVTDLYRALCRAADHRSLISFA